MFHYRESRGPEIDLLIDRGDCLHAIEIKSAATASSDFFRHFQALRDTLKTTRLPADVRNHVIYGGDESQQRSQASLVSWQDLSNML